jgi:hypothetical protein
MLSKNQVMDMFQNTYFGSIDKGEMTKAISVFHDDIEWIHTQVWEHDKYVRMKGSDRLKGKKEVENLLMERKAALAKENVRHVIQELVFEENKGAFIGHVTGSGKELALIAWFEIKDDKVYRYIVTPLFIP